MPIMSSANVSFFLLVSILFFFFPSTAVLASLSKCAAPPIALDYASHSIIPGSVNHGILLRIGNPPQHIVLTPNLMLDHTFIPRWTNSCVHVAGMDMQRGFTGNGSVKNVNHRALAMDPASASTSAMGLIKRDGHPGSFEEDLQGSGGAGNATTTTIKTEAVYKGWAEQDWRINCAELYGGGYDPLLSATYRKLDVVGPDQIFLSKRRNVTNWAFVSEKVSLVGYLDAYERAMDTVPKKGLRNLTAVFALPGNETLFAGLGSAPLGLTPNSTLLAALHVASMIPSTSWSLTNSTLCLGCKDKQAHTGDFHKFIPADPNADPKYPCLIQATVEALNYHPTFDTEGVSLIKGPFRACIDPGVKFFVLPDEVRSAFADIAKTKLKAEYDDYSVYEAEPNGATGRLHFKLEGGLEVNVSIPGLGPAGNEAADWRYPIGKGGWGAYGKDVMTLGKPFTDRVVLKWDSEAKEYGMANVNERLGEKEELEPLGCEDFPKKEHPHATTATGTIVGSVIGGFFGGLIFAAGGIYFFQRGERGPKSLYQPMTSEEALPMASMSTIGSRSRAVSPMSARSSFRPSSFRAVSPLIPALEPQMMENTAIYEAPEGGTACPSKRERAEFGP
ncbi:hypothetical protein P154DRAFT_559073 [Amniculicola lignicola CBS 123094]|uniref:Peptidase A1 domain-containing protein n=1 Tax=Amniculicola lignicola CBS 123094 TaxID=1392246 RepID=A0A6A5WZV4_9PLEO|nr:hypothetical protein P154DRAFT_559073 [Amniculicola lignicola CBS 123094]